MDYFITDFNEYISLQHVVRFWFADTPDESLFTGAQYSRSLGFDDAIPPFHLFLELITGRVVNAGIVDTCEEEIEVARLLTKIQESNKIVALDIMQEPSWAKVKKNKEK